MDLQRPSSTSSPSLHGLEQPVPSPDPSSNKGGSLLLDVGAKQEGVSYLREGFAARGGAFEGAQAHRAPPPSGRASKHPPVHEDTLAWLVSMEHGVPRCTDAAPPPDQKLLDFMQRPLDLQQLGRYASGRGDASCVLSSEGTLKDRTNLPKQTTVDHRLSGRPADRDIPPISRTSTSPQESHGPSPSKAGPAGSTPEGQEAVPAQAPEMAYKGEASMPSPQAPQAPCTPQQAAGKGRCRGGVAASEDGAQLSDETDVKRRRVAEGPQPVKRKVQSPLPPRASERQQARQQQRQQQQVQQQAQAAQQQEQRAWQRRLKVKEEEEMAHLAVPLSERAAGVVSRHGGAWGGAGRGVDTPVRGVDTRTRGTAPGRGVVSVVALPTSEAHTLEAAGMVDASAVIAAAPVPKAKAGGYVVGGVADKGNDGGGDPLGDGPGRLGLSAGGLSRNRCADAVAQALELTLPGLMSHPPAATEDGMVHQLREVEQRIVKFSQRLVGNLLEFLSSMGYSEEQANQMSGGCLDSLSEFQARSFKVILQYSHFVFDMYIKLMKTATDENGGRSGHMQSMRLSMILSKDMGPWLLAAHQNQLKNNVFEVWALMHLWDPRPSKDVISNLVAYTGRSRQQVLAWFSNWRARAWKRIVKQIGLSVDLLENENEGSDTDATVSE